MILLWLLRLFWLIGGFVIVFLFCLFPFHLIDSDNLTRSISIYFILCYFSISFFTHTACALSCFIFYFWRNYASPPLKHSFMKENMSSGIVLIPDVDIFFHMSGESYYKAIRIALLCMFLNCGIFDYFLSGSGFVGIVATLAKYQKPLRLFQRFSIKTKLVYWDNVNLYFEQSFVTINDETDVYFNALVSVQTIDCTPDDVLNFIEIYNLRKPPLTKEIQHFLNLNVATRVKHTSFAASVNR